ncbi:MAG: hypothetical protein A2Y33_08055 [Spirochaetes bacterium GWF1_51_8]|nr:MAG: hypothetical protein A2Y33_08055 [Spirochaetes bacterium GWF1_51_8]
MKKLIAVLMIAGLSAAGCGNNTAPEWKAKFARASELIAQAKVKYEALRMGDTNMIAEMNKINAEMEKLGGELNTIYQTLPPDQQALYNLTQRELVSNEIWFFTNNFDRYMKQK